MMRSTSSQRSSSVNANCGADASDRHGVVADAEQNAARDRLLVVLDFLLDEQLVLVPERARRSMGEEGAMPLRSSGRVRVNLDVTSSVRKCLCRFNVHRHLRRPELPLDRCLHGVGQLVRVVDRRRARDDDRDLGE